eukprot:gnl/MRDRNA2_/MRDRNA2_66486_c0_seq1.p1 gnl/MRDRNA2_/MRDRNA2_66486_c0~~gnl/MRDRNA2_/MRDRNA2_66486_c0_seq1.p1  ORF type:complete len:244 (-),score=27.78 gnl/MRDRNA2_/MRDRNA2_66486_c0_seq1:11-688(-)
MVAHSKLRGTSAAMLLCLLMFFGILTARLELEKAFQWPIYIDMIPLFILPCLLYLTATDFAATRISTEAALGKIVVVTTGFFVAVSLLILTCFIAMKMTYVVTWTWSAVLSPLWVSVLAAQMFICFLIPGFLRVDKLAALLVIFFSIWLVGLTLLLVGLKLDGELPHWLWTFTLIPVWVALALQLDKIIDIPWVCIFGPVLFLLFVDTLVICFGREKSEEDPAPM